MGSCVDRSTGISTSQIVPSLPADTILGETAANPDEKHGPASDKNWSCEPESA
jgi:hypothetical protein